MNRNCVDCGAGFVAKRHARRTPWMTLVSWLQCEDCWRRYCSANS